MPDRESIDQAIRSIEANAAEMVRLLIAHGLPLAAASYARAIAEQLRTIARLAPADR